MQDTLRYDSSNTLKKGVLGMLEGVCADTIRSTRNGRRYSEKLWENVFKDEIVQEYFQSGGLLGELNHPVDREETDLEKVAICMPEPPKKNTAGQLVGKWDILDTPNGRILKCLCDYGYKIGISSRGSGDLIEDWDGNEAVDPETYHLEAFDAVLLPAVKAARLSTVNESFVPTKSLKKALVESYNKATDEEKKVMSETLDALDIDYKDSSDIEEEDVTETTEEAVNDGALVEELQQALQDNAKLKSQLAALQEKLSVSYAKEIQSGEEVTRLRTAVSKLSESAKKVPNIQKQLADTQKELKEATSRCSMLTEQLQASKRRLSAEVTARAGLTESLEATRKSADTKDSELASLKESYEKKLRDNSVQLSTLNEQLAEAKANAEIQSKNYASKLASVQKLVAAHKEKSSQLLERYILSKAKMLGVSVDEIKNKLPQNATVDHIDSICEDLRSYKLNVNRLPFAIAGSMKSVVKTSDTSAQRFVNPDDDVDPSLFNIVNS